MAWKKVNKEQIIWYQQRPHRPNKNITKILTQKKTLIPNKQIIFLLNINKKQRKDSKKKETSTN